MTALPILAAILTIALAIGVVRRRTTRAQPVCRQHRSRPSAPVKP